MKLCYLVLIGLLATATWGNEWLLTTADFRQEAVSLKSVSDAAVEVAAADGAARQVSYEDFLQLDRPQAAKPAPQRFVLHLISGDRLVGQPTGYKGEQILWSSPAVGELSIPLKQVRSLVRAGRSAEPSGEARTEDLALLSNGDSVRGIVSDISASKITIDSNNNAVELPLDAIAALHFATATQGKAQAGRAFRISLMDGSMLTAPSIATAAEELHLKLADGSTRKLPLSSITTIEQLNGPVSWLSSRTPSAVVQTPYFGALAWPTRFDQTVGGRPITFGNRTYSRGIGVHAYSRLEYPLDGTYAAFRTQYAIAQDDKRQYADVTVRIKVDGQMVHEQKNFKADVLSPVISIDLTKEAKLLTLEVDYGDAGDTQDRLNWIEAALLRRR